MRRRRLACPSRHSAGGIWHSHKELAGHQSGVSELPRVQFSGAASTATEVLEPGALGWLHVREVGLRDGQMGSPDYPNTLVGTFPITTNQACGKLGERAGMKYSPCSSAINQ